MFIPSLLFYYGLFLILCGITSVLLIGMKAKTALASGGTAGVIAITIGHFVSQGSAGAQIAGVVVCLMLFIVFCWRSAKTLFTVFEFIPDRHPDLKAKAIAFLIISLMAVVTLMVLLLQLSTMTKSLNE
jgi:Na+/proline symporter